MILSGVSQVALNPIDDILSIITLYCCGIGIHLNWMRARYVKIYHASKIGPQESVSALEILHIIVGYVNSEESMREYLLIFKIIQCFLCISWLSDAFNDIKFTINYYGGLKELESKNPDMKISLYIELFYLFFYQFVLFVWCFLFNIHATYVVSLLFINVFIFSHLSHKLIVSKMINRFETNVLGQPVLIPIFGLWMLLTLSMLDINNRVIADYDKILKSEILVYGILAWTGCVFFGFVGYTLKNMKRILNVNFLMITPRLKKTNTTSKGNGNGKDKGKGNSKGKAKVKTPKKPKKQA